MKDVFEAVMKNDMDKPVSTLARPPYFVSETKKVSELLREFQSEHLQVAVVVDEYGGTAGIITIEDVVEEIVGDNEYLVSGQLRIDALEEMLDVQLAGDDYETVAGLIFTTTGRIPKSGATIKRNG